MDKGIFITGTDTGVGKTVVSALLARYLKREGVGACVMKPIQTGALYSGDRLISQDAEFVRKAAGMSREEASSSYLHKLPLSPYAAFNSRQRKKMIKAILDAFNALRLKYEFVIVEGSGGIMAPIDTDYNMAHLAQDMGLPVIIVARPGLGTLNHTLLTIEYARASGLEVKGVIMNHAHGVKVDLSAGKNAGIIEKISGVPLIGRVPHIKGIDVERMKAGGLPGGNKIYIDTKPVINDGPVNKRGTGLLRDWDKKFIWHPFTQMRDWVEDEPLVITEGRGSYLKDSQGKWYLDGVSSLWVNVHGHRKKEIDQALRRQLNKIAHSTFLGLSNDTAILLSKRLIEIAPGDLNKVFYSDSGSTAVEAALKMAFQYWQQKEPRLKAKRKFISFVNAYHGDTVGSVSVGGIDLFHKIYRPLLFGTIKAKAPYCYRCPLGKVYPQCRLKCLKETEDILKKQHKSIAGVIIEPMAQAAAGILTQPAGYLRQLRRLCDKYDVLMILDEVAVGFGRTGRMFACEQEGVKPDILCLAKGLSAGYLPLAATLATDEIYKAFLGDYAGKKTFFHGHSYTANPLGCAAALANLEVFRKERTLETVQEKIRFLRKGLKRFYELKAVGDVRQAGLIAGIELVKNRKTKQPYKWEEKTGIRVTRQARKYGVILRPLGNVIVLFPPLSISLPELEELLDVTYRSIEEVTS